MDASCIKMPGLSCWPRQDLFGISCILAKDAAQKRIELVASSFAFLYGTRCFKLASNTLQVWLFRFFAAQEKMKIHTKNKAIYKRIAGLLLGNLRISW